MKRDGSLWGWGNDYHYSLGDAPAKMSEGPVRVGSDSDWVAVADSDPYLGDCYMAIKSDGSAWKWGFFPHAKSSDPQSNWRHETTPVQWTTAGTNWVLVDGDNGRRFLAFQEHGGLWVSRSKVGEPKSDWMFGYDANRQRVENGRAFPELKKRARRIVLEQDGSLYHLSKYSDWVSPGEWLSVGLHGRSESGLAGLAADGTLSFWNLSTGILAPSRRPAWSINILNDK